MENEEVGRKGSLHEILLKSKINEYKAKAFRVIRLDHSYMPDAIIVDWTNRKVVALEVEIGRGTCQYARTTKRWGQKTNRSEFDNVTLVYPNRRGRTIEEFNNVKKLRNSGLGPRSISDKTGIPIDTIRDWLYRRAKPQYWRRVESMKKLGIILEEVSLKSLRK